MFSTNGCAPFTPHTSIANPQDNNITQAGFYFLGGVPWPPEIFDDGFE